MTHTQTGMQMTRATHSTAPPKVCTQLFSECHDIDTRDAVCCQGINKAIGITARYH